MLGPTSFTAIKLTQDKQVRRNTNTPPPLPPAGFTLFRVGKEASNFCPADSKSMSWGDLGNFSSWDETYREKELKFAMHFSKTVAWHPNKLYGWLFKPPWKQKW